jgi:outer membrane biosynthesis protein TonB
MKRYNGEDGSEVDEMEAANKSEEAMDIADSMSRGSAGTSETVKAKPKAMPKAMPKPAAKTESAPAAKTAPVDETKLSLSDRMKLSRDRAKAGSTTDTRSVSQRLRAAFGMKKGGATKKMASGGMTSSSASKRADGIAVKGKTRGKMC